MTETESSLLRTMVSALATARTREAAARTAVAQLEAKHATVYQELGHASLQRSQAESVLREWPYHADGSKHPAPGLSLTATTRLNYSPAAAILWVLEHKHITLLSLKVAPFEKVAAGLQLPFVTTTEMLTVSIARDLTAAVAELEAEQRVANEVHVAAAPSLQPEGILETSPLHDEDGVPLGPIPGPAQDVAGFFQAVESRPLTPATTDWDHSVHEAAVQF